MAGIQSVVEYLDNYVANAKQVEEIEKLEKQIELLRKSKQELEEIVRTKFINIDRYHIDIDYFTTRISLVKELDADRIDELKQFIFLLASNYDSEMEAFGKARNAFKEIIRDFNTAISLYHREIKSTKEVQNIELVNLIERLIKKNQDGTIRISGNISLDEFNKIIELFEKINIPMEDRIEFINELNQSIANFKYRKEQIITKIEEEDTSKKLDILTGASKPTDRNSIIPRKKPTEFDFSRIKKIISILQEKYESELVSGLDVSIIDANTPFNKDRSRLYYEPDSNQINYKVILFDLLNYINPDNIQSMIDGNNTTRENAFFIKDRLYPEIVKICNPLVKEKRKELAGRAKAKRPEAIEIQAEKEEKITPVEPPVKPIEVLEPSPLVEGEVIPSYDMVGIAGNNFYLTAEETEKIESAIEKGNKYIIDFRERFGLTDAICKMCLDPEMANYYKVDINIIRIIINDIPALKDDYKEYNRFYRQITVGKEKAAREDIELLDEFKDGLIQNADELVEKLETYLIPEPEPEENVYDADANNIIIVPFSSDDKTSIIIEDVKKILKTGQIDLDVLYDRFKRMHHLDTLHPKSPTLESCKCADKWIERTYNPYRYREGDLRYVYVNINVCDENLEELKEAYGIANDNIRLLYIPTVIYKRGDRSGYTEAEQRIKKICGYQNNNIDTIEWVKSIFNKPFTDETRQIAFELINYSNTLIEKIKAGELDNVPRV